MQPFDQRQFNNFSDFIKDTFGIHFSAAKKELLRSKLQKILLRHKLDSFDEYYRILKFSGHRDYLMELANEITINKTDFFREINHFEFIGQKFNLILEKNKRILKKNEIRMWSAGCSTGQEPYSAAMVLKECLPPGVKIKILATDINTRTLATAIAGVYAKTIEHEVPPSYLDRYFTKSGSCYTVCDSIRRMVTFREFNFARPFPFNGAFDLIFCRNVMIYFDGFAQQQLLDKFYDCMTPGGLLFIGHSESLTGKKHKFQYLRPTIYVK